MTHTHDGDRLTFGCPACINAAEQARWDNAPMRNIRFSAIVPRHIATLKGKQIKWTFTARRRIPDSINWRGDDELDYDRFDVGAEMIESMPRLGGVEMDAVATAELFIDSVEPIEQPDAPDTPTMF